MQIKRIDVEPHHYAAPKGPARPQGVEPAQTQSGGSGRSQQVSGTADSQLGDLLGRLKETAEVRPEAVQAAREKIAGGELTTRESAEQLASTLLQEFFPHHS